MWWKHCLPIKSFAIESESFQPIRPTALKTLHQRSDENMSTNSWAKRSWDSDTSNQRLRGPSVVGGNIPEICSSGDMVPYFRTTTLKRKNTNTVNRCILCLDKTSVDYKNMRQGDQWLTPNKNFCAQSNPEHSLRPNKSEFWWQNPPPDDVRRLVSTHVETRHVRPPDPLAAEWGKGGLKWVLG